MSKISLVVLSFCLLINTSVADTIALWTFESPNTPTNQSVTGSYPNPVNPSVGSGSLTTLHSSLNSTAYTTQLGNGSATSFSATRWTAGDYWQFQVNASNYMDISIGWDQTSDAAGPRNFELWYSIDNVNFTNHSLVTSTPIVVLENGASPNAAWNSSTSDADYSYFRDLSSVNTLEGDSSIYFRLRLLNSTSANGGSIASTGKNLIDNVLISGTQISNVPEPSTAGLLSLAALGLIAFKRRHRR